MIREERLRSTAALRHALPLTSWRGRSGRRYVVGVHACGEPDLADVTDAVVIAVERPYVFVPPNNSVLLPSLLRAPLLALLPMIGPLTCEDVLVTLIDPVTPSSIWKPRVPLKPLVPVTCSVLLAEKVAWVAVLVRAGPRYAPADTDSVPPAIVVVPP